jgi:predicted O-methyltransferase YrrM
MTQQLWTDVDSWFSKMVRKPDPVLESVLKSNAAAGLPAIDVSPAQGNFLHVLARSLSARRILEIGTLGGYSSIWLARALPPNGKLVTLELEALHAEVALKNFQRAGLADRIELRMGNALDSLAALKNENIDPFDFIFIDADKPRSREYFGWSIQLSRPGGVIVVDNVVREGAVLDPNSDDENVQGIQRLAEMLATEHRVTTSVVQTVGSKGHDGFVMAIIDE